MNSQLLEKITSGLSPEQLKSLKPNVNVLTNDSLTKHGLPSGKRQDFVLFYPLVRSNGQEQGHYITVIQSLDPNKIFYYDSYGLVPHEITKDSPQHEILGYNSTINGLLGRLLYDTHRQIDYSPFIHQIDHPDISTCGRHCLLRLTFKHLNNEQYHKLLMKTCQRHQLKPDVLVAKISQFLTK